MGMITSLTTESTILAKAAPMITPRARSTTFPLTANSRNSCSSFIPVPCCVARRSMRLGRRGWKSAVSLRYNRGLTLNSEEILEDHMSNSTVDASKRTWLIASGCAGAVGAGFTAVPFVSSFQPSERAKAAGAPVEVDISALRPGEKMTVEWRGKPVWIMKRTPEQVAALPKLDAQLADPKSERTAYPTPDYAK